MASEVKFHLGVKALIRDEVGRILLVRIRTEALSGYSGPAYWDIPGGRVQWGGVVRYEDTGQINWEDTIIRTLEREIEEETGLTGINSFQPFSFLISNISYPSDSGEIVGLLLRLYLCEAPKVAEIKISQEHSEYGWYTPGETARLLRDKFPSEFCRVIEAL